MADMVETFHGDHGPQWSFNTYYDYNDYNNRREVDPQYTQDYITRYMNPPIEIRCCSECEDRLRIALNNIPGVDRVVSTYNNRYLMVTGSADENTIHYALKHIRKHHYHFLPRKIHNPFRGLFLRHSHSRYAHSLNQTSHVNQHTSYANYEYDDTWKYGEKYGHGYGKAPQQRYKPGSVRHALFDRYRPSNYSHSGYTYY